MSLKERLDINNIPQHVAIIMDGNGRWAKQRQHDRTFGHESGVVSVKETVEAAAEIGIKYLTLYAFSTENWSRPKEEVDALMSLLVKTINQETKTLNKNNIRLQAIGDLKSLEKETYTELQKAIENTASNTQMTLILALSYSSRWEITDAIQKMAKQIQNNSIKPEDINQELISSFLTTSNYPDPELLIRTSGEYRISNFLLWQIAYSELYFTPILWPDFRKENLFEAILDYQNRERRFGKISEQLLNF
jgi:undecaprenyl diphosphate synthase